MSDETIHLDSDKIESYIQNKTQDKQKRISGASAGIEKDLYENDSSRTIEVSSSEDTEEAQYA